MTKRFLFGVGRWARRAIILVVVMLMAPAWLYATDDRGDDSWRTADRHSAQLAPLPSEHPEAVVQIYAARAFRWRGAFAVHTWIAVKPRNADAYMTHHVLGWRGGRKVVGRIDTPDRYWYGARPDLLVDLRGAEAETLLEDIADAIERYPHADRYRAWPGPNSNTFIAWIGHEVPELRLDMPSTAIGKDYPLDGAVFDGAISGTGVRASLGGLLGATVALEEGLEINILGLAVGIDPLDLSLRLPGFGTVGPALFDRDDSLN
jgi:hypothetical protein